MRYGLGAMTLKLTTQFPGGNAADITITETGAIPEVFFAADPCGGPEALWFNFRLEETSPDPARHTKIKLIWNYFDTVLGATESPTCLPVCQTPGQPWIRLKQGEEGHTPDGRRQLSWLIPHPAPSIEIAFCFPYGTAEMDATLSRAKNYWQTSPIGLSQQSRRIVRLYNSPGTPGSKHPGIYIVARQHSGETPGSWVLDGFLRHLSQLRKAGFVIWVVPFANIDGVVEGHYGKDGFPYDLNRAWGSPPMRHETHVIRRDIMRWKAACRPILALDLHAPGACERDGVYAFASDKAGEALSADEAKWCNVLQQELTPEFAAPDFKRVAKYASRWETPSFTAFMRDEMSIPALSLEIPYSHTAGGILTQNSYREIGRRLAQGIMRRTS